MAKNETTALATIASSDFRAIAVLGEKPGALAELIKENIFKDDRIVTFKIPFSEGRYLDELNVRGTVLETTYEEDGTVVSANVSPELHSRLSRFETH